nr:ribonuclease H-like domain-containing protein [Tanacetum cinerariifolium]
MACTHGRIERELLGIMDFNILLLVFILSAAGWNYCWFQTLLSQLKIHGAGVSHEDANQNFLRSLPSSGSQVALIMRTKPGLDTLSFDDLYNNLRVFERDVKGYFARDCRAKGNQDIRRRDAEYNGNKTREMVEDLHIRMTQKLWLPLMESILTGLDMLRKMLKTML